MSPRAAWRLEGLGFSEVYDYVPGKADWFAAGLPMEGTRANTPTIGDAARRDVPTYSPQVKIGAARERVREAGWDRCVVVGKERVVLGLREQELDADPEATAEEAIGTAPPRFGPTSRWRRWSSACKIVGRPPSWRPPLTVSWWACCPGRTQRG